MVCVPKEGQSPRTASPREELLKEGGMCLLPWSRRKLKIAQHNCCVLTVPMSAGSLTGRQTFRKDSVHSGKERGSAGAGRVWGLALQELPVKE